ncbi:MAG: hypothetical protein ACREUT_03935 [Steroidobacteraceae bacterium]
MQAQHAFEEPRLQLPADLLSELKRRGAMPRTDMHVEGWKPTLLGRLVDLLTGRRHGPSPSRR